MLFLLRIVLFITLSGFIHCVKIKWGEETDSGHWGSLHRMSFPLTIGDKHYFFGMTDITDGKYWFIQELGEGGKVKSETSTGTWNFYYKNIFPFTINGKQYIFAVTDESYRNYWFIQEVLPGGIMGPETDNGYWQSTPTMIFPYSAGGGHYVYTLSGKDWYITELLRNGKKGRETERGSWQFEYTLGFPFAIDGRTYFYSISDNYWFIQELLPYGKMGVETANGHWPTTHKVYVPFSIDEKHYVYGVIDENSQWFIQELLPGGKMGDEKLKGSWQFYYNVSFAFQINQRQYLYGHTLYEKYWFIQEIIQEPRFPMLASSKESYCNDDASSSRPRRQVTPTPTNNNVIGYALNAIEAFINDIENMVNSIYVTQYFNNPDVPMRSVTTMRVFADANHPNHQDLTVAMRARIYYNHTRSRRDPRISDEVYDHLRQMDRENDDEAGHLLASSLGGLASIWNFVAQSPMVNRAVRVVGSVLPQSGWYALEDLLREYLFEVGDNGYIDWSLGVSYRHLPDSRRPTEFYLSVRFYDALNNLVDWRGHGAVREYIFPNVPTVACSNLNNPWWQ